MKSLSVLAEEIGPTKSMDMYNVDSLIRGELRNWFTNEMKADIAIFNILRGGTFEAVALIVAKKTRYTQNDLEQ